MKRFGKTTIVLGLLLGLHSACRTTDEGDSAVKADGASPPPMPVGGTGATTPTDDIWTCPATSAGGPAFALRDFASSAVRGYLSGPATLVFNCKKADPAVQPEADGAKRSYDCKLTPGQDNPAQFGVLPLKKPDGTYATLVTNTQGLSAPLACFNNDVAPAVVPTFADVAPILEKFCSNCHDGDTQEPKLVTLDDFKAARASATSVVNARFMPFKKKTWLDTPDGRKVQAWLKWSPELGPVSP